VLSNDSGLVDAVTTAAGEQFPIQRLPTLKALRSLVDTGQCRIALLDAEFFGSAVRARITELKALEPELVVVVAAPRETAEELMGLFAERVIHRLLIKPPAIGITRLFLESAVSRFLQIRAAHEETLAQPVPELRPPRGPFLQGSRSAWILAIALATVLIAGVVVGGYMRGGSEEVAPSSTTLAAPLAAPLDTSQAAVDSSIGSDVTTDNAVEATPLASTTELSPPSSDVAVSDVTTAPLPVVEIEDDVAAGGAAFVADAPPVTSDEVRAAANTILPARSVSAVIAAAPPSELDSLLTIARARIERGQLVEPAGDSARDYVGRALALDEESEAALAMRAEVATGVVASGRAELESGDVERATALAAEARRLGATNEALARLEVDLQAARGAAAERAQGELLALGEARMQEGRLVAPERDSALFYFQSLYAENPEYPGLEDARAELAALLTRNAEQAITDKNWPNAEAWIGALASVAEPEDVDLARADLAAARVQEV
jgi:hypothetical protein